MDLDIISQCCVTQPQSKMKAGPPAEYKKNPQKSFFVLCDSNIP